MSRRARPRDRRRNQAVVLHDLPVRPELAIAIAGAIQSVPGLNEMYPGSRNVTSRRLNESLGHWGRLRK